MGSSQNTRKSSVYPWLVVQDDWRLVLRMRPCKLRIRVMAGWKDPFCSKAVGAEQKFSLSRQKWRPFMSEIFSCGSYRYKTMYCTINNYLAWNFTAFKTAEHQLARLEIYMVCSFHLSQSKHLTSQFIGRIYKPCSGLRRKLHHPSSPPIAFWSRMF